MTATLSPQTTARFGVSGRSTAERAPSLTDTDRWQFSHQWEMLELDDGSMFFDSVYADHKAISSPSSTLRAALRLIDDGPVSLADVAGHVTSRNDASTVTRLGRLLEPLMRAGILVPHRLERRPAWADDALVDRFSTQIEWLGALERDDATAWDYLGRLREATVSIIGLGGAGSLLAQALTAAGVGRLILVDGDTVERSNLVRQVLYTEAEVGQPKAACLARRLREFSPYTELDVRQQFVQSPDDVADSIAGADLVAVCADAPRFVLNRWIDAACKAATVPYLGALAGIVGPFYRPGRAGCFGCMEHQFRAELGERHDLVVAALAAKKQWRYPAFVSGPLSVSHLLTTEIVLYLTGAAEPSCAGSVVRLSHPHAVLEKLPVAEDCDCHD